MALHMTIRKSIELVGVLVLLHAATGCQELDQSGMRPVRIVATFPDANSSICLDNGKPAKYADVMAFGDDAEKSKPYAELLLMPGDLLPLEFKGKYHDHVPKFWYVFRSEDSQPLVFSAKGPVVLLAGQPIYLDLSRPGAAAWLASLRPGDLGTLRGVSLSNDMDVNLTALRLLAHSGVLIDCSHRLAFDREGDRRLAEAILETDPTGLILDDGTGLDHYLPRLKNLTHLVMGWPSARALPSLAEAPRLQVLYLDVSDARRTEPDQRDVKVDLGLIGLDRLPDLRTFFLYGHGCRFIKDFTALDELRGLRHLTLSDCDRLSNLSSLPRLYGLTGLEIVCKDDIPMTGLEHLALFQKLVKLSLFCNLSKEPDLRPLAKLKQLRILVLPKKVLDERKAEADDLRKAMPNCRIYGMCMGSRWILAILAAGLGLGAVLRRFMRNKLAAI